jgi:hypothetical protein
MRAAALSERHGFLLATVRHVYLTGQLRPRVEAARGSAGCRVTPHIGAPIAAGISGC